LLCPCGQRGEALVVVIVAHEHEVHPGAVEDAPDLGHLRVVPVTPQREHRVMPVRERAARRVRGEVGADPLELRRAGVGGDVSVEGDHVPGADFVAVMAAARGARGLAEVLVDPPRQ
jgi:hypothetical protein